MMPKPPNVPRINLELVDASAPQQPFLELRRQMLTSSFPDGTSSPPFSYDHVLRAALDAVVIVAHYQDDEGQQHVYLRSSVRPPLALRADERDEAHLSVSPVLWEVPAGLIEPDEQRGDDGPARCASREIAEELGFHVPASALRPLGPPTLPAPAVLAERHFYLHCVVDPSTRQEPSGDGSPLEDGAIVIDVLLSDALAWVKTGQLPDAKTEMALRRLEELLA